jgi:hypothetical protein
VNGEAEDMNNSPKWSLTFRTVVIVGMLAAPNVNSQDKQQEDKKAQATAQNSQSTKDAKQEFDKTVKELRDRIDDLVNQVDQNKRISLTEIDADTAEVKDAIAALHVADVSSPLKVRGGSIYAELDSSYTRATWMNSSATCGKADSEEYCAAPESSPNLNPYSLAVTSAYGGASCLIPQAAANAIAAHAGWTLVIQNSDGQGGAVDGLRVCTNAKCDQSSVDTQGKIFLIRSNPEAAELALSGNQEVFHNFYKTEGDANCDPAGQKGKQPGACDVIQSATLITSGGAKVSCTCTHPEAHKCEIDVGDSR